MNRARFRGIDHFGLTIRSLSVIEVETRQDPAKRAHAALIAAAC